MAAAKAKKASTIAVQDLTVQPASVELNLGNKSIEPNLGNKLDYAFGKATGRKHSIDRSIDNMRQLSVVGIHDNPVGRQILSKQIIDTFQVNKNLIMSGNSVTIDSLLIAPGGFKGMQTIWEGLNLKTIRFFGGGINLII